MISLKDGWDGIKSISGVISRIVGLENRVTVLEKKLSELQIPPADIKTGLEYNQKWNFYMNKVTGENFCGPCIGNGKKLPVVIKANESWEGWRCNNCNTTQGEFKSREKPRYSLLDID